MSISPEVIRVKLPKLHAMQRQISREAERFNIVDTGRRIGKSVLAEDKLITPALYGHPTAFMTPEYSQLMDRWRSINYLLRDVIADVSKQEKRILLKTGGTIEFFSLRNIDAVLGRFFKRLIIDEAARDRGLDYSFNTVLRPTLNDLRGDAWIFSTPFGHDYFWELWKKGQPGDDKKKNYKSWQIPSAICNPDGSVRIATNPYISAVELEEVRATMPIKQWEQEYLASFDARVGAVFQREWFNIFIDRSQLPPGLKWYRYWDTASSVKESGDFSASIAVAWDHEDTMYIRDIINEKREFNGLVDLMKQTFILDQQYDTVQGIEQKANGINIFQKLKDDPELRQSGSKPFPIEVVGDKWQRANKWSWYPQHGKLKIVNGPKVFDFIDQASSFVGVDDLHDDMVDSVSGGYYMSHSKFSARAPVR